MRNPARRSTSRHAFEADEHYLDDEFVPGDRAGPPLVRRRRKALLRGVVILGALSGGWALLDDQASWPPWLQFDTMALSTWIDRNMRGPVEPAVPTVASASPSGNAAPTMKPAPLEPPPSSEPTPVPGRTAVPADAAATVPPLSTAALPPASSGGDDSQAASLRPSSADPADPYQMRAEAVGLHPDLSRVLLTRLSPADYRNAGIAIQTAMAETSDSAVFIWPRQRKPELAHFKVHFVPGAAQGCRRYVVTVTKDGWMTTALPMEKCGSAAGRTRRE